MSNVAATLANPLAGSGVGSVSGLLLAILNVLVIIAIPIVVFFLIYAGFLYVMAQGNPEKIKQAGKALLYGIIGGVVIVGSVAILNIIKSVTTQF